MMRKLRVRFSSELPAYGSPIASVPSLLIVVLAYSRGDAANRGFATTSTHVGAQGW